MGKLCTISGEDTEFHSQDRTFALISLRDHKAYLDVSHDYMFRTCYRALAELEL